MSTKVLVEIQDWAEDTYDVSDVTAVEYVKNALDFYSEHCKISGYKVRKFDG